MIKKYIILVTIFGLATLLLSSCGKRVSIKDNPISYNGRRDRGMNIIESERNIKNIPLDIEYKKFRLEDVIDEEYKEALIVGELGQMINIQEEGYFQKENGFFNYIGRDRKILVENVKGVMLNPPKASITDAYYDISNSLEDTDVLFILLDGFGYHQYIYALENGYLPFLGKQPRAVKALSVYKPVTNAGLAAIITGKYPVENGVHSRRERELMVDSIFKLAKDLNKRTIYLEGDIGILKTEIQPVLHLDENKDGFTDDEVFESTMDAIREGYNFIFTHFHGIDDCGHTYGDLSKETMEFINRVDGYLEEIISKWKGKVIITADHGVHSTETGGDHGEFRYENMVVPYITAEGGN